MTGTQIVVKYAKRDSDSREKIRSMVMPAAMSKSGGINWFITSSLACGRARPGERIVAIIESGYH